MTRDATNETAPEPVLRLDDEARRVIQLRLKGPTSGPMYEFDSSSWLNEKRAERKKRR